MKIKNLLFILTISLLIFSCKGKDKNKKESENNFNTQKTETVDVKKTNSNNPLILKAKEIFNNQDTFSTVEIKFNLELKTAERNVSGSGTLRMANDSIIWLYVKALGFEVARATMTKDSVMAVVKLKNQYFKGDYSCLKQIFPVDFDFEILQSIFLNKFFLFPTNKIENLNYFDPEEESGILKLTSNDFYKSSYQLSDEIIINTSTNRVETNSAMLTAQNKGLKIKYSNIKQFGPHKLPENVVFEGIGTDFSVSFEYKKIDFGKKLSYPLTIPASYTPLKF